METFKEEKLNDDVEKELARLAAAMEKDLGDDAETEDDSEDDELDEDELEDEDDSFEEEKL